MGMSIARNLCCFCGIELGFTNKSFDEKFGSISQIVSHEWIIP